MNIRRAAYIGAGLVAAASAAAAIKPNGIGLVLQIGQHALDWVDNHPKLIGAIGGGATSGIYGFNLWCNGEAEFRHIFKFMVAGAVPGLCFSASPEILTYVGHNGTPIIGHMGLIWGGIGAGGGAVLGPSVLAAFGIPDSAPDLP